MYRVLAALFCLRYAYAQTASPQDLLKEAISAQQSKHFEEAVRDYRLILEKYPNIAEVRSNLGAALAGEGLYTEAIVEYKRALALHATPQAKLNLALAYYKVGDFKLASENLHTLHKETPNDSQVVTLLADCYLKLGDNTDVIALLTPIQQVQPDNTTFVYLLGTALVRDGQTDKGQMVIDKILRNGDSAESRLLMGTAKFMVSDFAGARDDFQKAVELNSSLPELYAYYGMAMLSTGDQAGARKAFEHELKSDPNNFVANLHMGVCCGRMR